MLKSMSLMNDFDLQWASPRMGRDEMEVRRDLQVTLPLRVVGTIKDRSDLGTFRLRLVIIH